MKPLQNNNNYQRPIRIEVCGGIASGKTTFAQLLNNAGIDAVFEDFQSNPFLNLYYSDLDKYAFEAEITFLLQHYNGIKVKNEHSPILVCDFSLYLDLAYASVTLRETRHQVYRAVYDEVQRSLGSPDLLVYIHTSVNTSLQRIRGRNREFEKSIESEFLEAINKTLEYHVNERKNDSKVIRVDSEKYNFAADEKVRKELAAVVIDSLSSTHTIEEFK